MSAETLCAREGCGHSKAYHFGVMTGCLVPSTDRPHVFCSCASFIASDAETPPAPTGPLLIMDGTDWGYNVQQDVLRIGHIYATPQAWITAIERIQSESQQKEKK